VLNFEIKPLLIGRLNSDQSNLPAVTIGDRIRAGRVAAGWSMRELSARMKVSPSAVTQWESGQTTPSIANRADLSHLLNIPFVDLVPEVTTNRPGGLTDPLIREIVQLVPKLPIPMQKALLVQILAAIEALAQPDSPPEK
jgi:transcriptional regulator with XRE-family HTH domain